MQHGQDSKKHIMLGQSALGKIEGDSAARQRRRRPTNYMFLRCFPWRCGGEDLGYALRLAVPGLSEADQVAAQVLPQLLQQRR